MACDFITVEKKAYEALQKELEELRQLVVSTEQNQSSIIQKPSQEQMRLFAEAASRESEARFGRMADSVPGMIYQFQLRADGTMSFPYVSSGCRELFQVEPEQVYQDVNNIFSVIHPEDLPGLMQTITVSAQTMQNWEYEWRIITISGQQKWLKGISKPEQQSDDFILWNGCVVEISDRHQAEEALKHLNEQLEARIKERTAALNEKTSELQAILNAFPDLFFRLAFDSTILDYKASSDRSHELYIPPKVFLGKRMVDILPPSVGEQFQQAIVELKQSSSLVSIEYLLSMPTGQEYYYEGRLVPFTNNQIILIVRNVSDRKQIEIQLQQQTQDLEKTLYELQHTQTQLIQSEKMSSLGSMIAGIAHEINNPVNFIHGNLIHASEYTQELLRLVELYQQHYPNPLHEIQAELEATDLDFLKEDLVKIFQSMQVGTHRIREIVLSLRNFSRLDEAEFKKVDIHEGIDSTLMILHSRLKAKPNSPEILVIKEYGNLPLIECYPGQLNQVFMNILANAIDALEEGNNSQLTTPQICICTEVIDKNWVGIRIVDNGSGIPEKILSKLFDPFFTTKDVGKGTGLGLSISYQIVVEKHHGKLFCNSILGQGTEFIIQIPIIQL